MRVKLRSKALKINEKYFVIAAHGLIKKGDKYLLTKRAQRNDYMPGFWDLPGGSIRFGEKAESALKREILEETDLKIKLEEIIFVYGHKSDESRHQFQLVYKCQYLEGEVKLNPEEHSEYRWASIGEMKGLKKIAFLNALFKELDSR